MMSIGLWIVQVLLAAHTAMGAVWKVNHGPKAVPALRMIPKPVWLAMAAGEVACALGLVAPLAYAPLMGLVPVAAGLIALEMLAFCGLHLASGKGKPKEMIYWLVVAAVCAVVIAGRLA
jgi:hypothetical protein